MIDKGLPSEFAFKRGWAVVTSQAVAIISAMMPLFFLFDGDNDDDRQGQYDFFAFYMMLARNGKI